MGGREEGRSMKKEGLSGPPFGPQTGNCRISGLKFFQTLSKHNYFNIKWLIYYIILYLQIKMNLLILFL
jgi:hypothetical protein